MTHSVTKTFCIGLTLFLAGCAPSSYVIKKPSVSNLPYESTKSPSNGKLAITDNRNENSEFSYGVLKADLILEGQKLDPVEFLKSNTAAELKSRGIDINLSDNSDTNVEINKLVMRNHRTNGYTPFITLTMLSADIFKEEKKERIAVFIKRGKVPVWSFDEIVEPTLNEPLELLVKEFSAKLNSSLFGARLGDDEIVRLTQKIKTQKSNGNNYLDVYQLGFSNNLTAVPYLKEMVNTGDEYVRMAAISSLGILKDEDSISLLKELSESANSWTDRAMALKSIGDIGGEEAMAYLKAKRDEFGAQDSKEAIWSAEIIDLYL